MNRKAIVESIAKFYLESGDFNGYPVSNLKREFGFSDIEAKSVIRNLIRLRKIDIVFGNIHPNPHIKAFSNISSRDQLRDLENLEFSDYFCLYPSSELLIELPDIKRFEHAPYKMALAHGAGQLDFRVFDLSVLEYYRNDPRYYYETNFIGGWISIKNEHFESNSMPENDQVMLQSFGFAYDDNLNRTVAVFLRYLSKLTPEHQWIWAAKALKGNYKLHPDYFRNSILGEWCTRISIFEAFTQELTVINEMTVLMGKAHLFRESYTKGNPKEFGFLLRPTLSEFNNFVLLLDKMISDNINKKFFVPDLSLVENKMQDDGRIDTKQKGTIALLDEWVRKYFRPADIELVNQMCSTFRNVRKLRQEPAHAVKEDIFDQEYFKTQRQLIIDAYSAVRTLRLILANHPNVRKNPPKIGEHLYKGEIWEI